MQNKKNFLPLFLLFLFLSIMFFFLSHAALFTQFGLFSSPLFSLQGELFRLKNIPANALVDKKQQTREEEILSLQSQLVHMQQLEKENAALRDQFQTSDIASSDLLPAEIIGDPQFIPGIQTSENITLNKGSQDGVEVGNTVVYKNNFVGMITAVTNSASSVTLANNKATSLTARTSQTNAQGVLTGQGSAVMVLGNVLLSDHLKEGDSVLTSGSEDIAGKGIAPNLIVGKIISVEKNPSSLYQSASVASLLHVEKLTTVFIMIKK